MAIQHVKEMDVKNFLSLAVLCVERLLLFGWIIMINKVITLHQNKNGEVISPSILSIRAISCFILAMFESRYQ